VEKHESVLELTPKMAEDYVAVAASGLTLLPLTVPDFVAGLADEQVRALLARWRSFAADAHDDFSRLEVDLVLHATCQRLGLTKEQREIAERLEKESAAVGEWPLGDWVSGFTEQLRKAQPSLKH
jgi:hypothetical protein